MNGNRHQFTYETLSNIIEFLIASNWKRWDCSFSRTSHVWILCRWAACSLIRFRTFVQSFLLRAHCNVCVCLCVCDWNCTLVGTLFRIFLHCLLEKIIRYSVYKDTHKYTHTYTPEQTEQPRYMKGRMKSSRSCYSCMDTSIEFKHLFCTWHCARAYSQNAFTSNW